MDSWNFLMDLAGRLPAHVPSMMHMAGSAVAVLGGMIAGLTSLFAQDTGLGATTTTVGTAGLGLAVAGLISGLGAMFKSYQDSKIELKKVEQEGRRLELKEREIEAMEAINEDIYRWVRECGAWMKAAKRHYPKLPDTLDPPHFPDWWIMRVQEQRRRRISEGRPLSGDEIPAYRPKAAPKPEPEPKPDPSPRPEAP